MSTLLWSPTFDPSPEFALPRPYLDYLTVSWWGVSYVSRGNPIVLEEHVFGGYTVVAQFQPWYWTWSSKTVQLKNLFSDFYAFAPGGVTPINAGPWLVEYKVDGTYGVPEIVLQSIPCDGQYHWNGFLPAPAGYWPGRRIAPNPVPPP